MGYKTFRFNYFEDISKKLNELNKNYKVEFIAFDKSQSGKYSLLVKLENN